MAWNWSLHVLVLLCLNLCAPICASSHSGLGSSNTTAAANPIVTPGSLHHLSPGGSDLKRREDDDGGTCGYHDGDPDRPRTAEKGFECRIDTERGLWGFCPTTVVVASDCGLAGSCVDKHACSKGCGIQGSSGITTFTCEREQFCSTVIMALNDDAGFSYIACGATALTHTIYPRPSDSPTTQTTESSGAKSLSGVPSETSDLAGSSTPTSELDSASDDDSGGPPNNTGAIIGGVIGGLALVCISAVATIYLLRRSRNQKAMEENTNQIGAPMPAYYTYNAYDAAPQEQHVISELDGRRNSKPMELPG